jgi:hypothetical protein
MNLHKITWWLTITKMRFTRGQSWLYFVKDMAMLIIGVYVVKDILVSFGVPVEWFKWIYLIAPIGYILACYYIGVWDEKHGTWKKESEYGTRDLNPIFETMIRQVDQMHKEIVHETTTIEG